MTVNSRMEAIVGCTLAMRNRLDRTHILKNTLTPILWVQGKEDQTLPMDNFYAQVEMCKQPITHILEETGHVAMIERPFETVKIIESFLNHCYGKHSSSL
jgi:pimeloyl-ACP methyl ester carboxylesterase